MKVIHVNTLLGKGGAALIAESLAIEMSKKYAVNYNFLVKKILSSKACNVSDLNTGKLFGYRKLSRILSESGLQYCFLPFESCSITDKIKKYKPDIIHLHNIHGGYFQLNLLEKLSKFAPVVWTFHDMFPFTGHCAYSFDCEKWQHGCGDCPRLGVYPGIEKDRTKFLWKYKSRIYKKSQFIIVTPSQWLQNCVKKSMLKDKDIRLIYNGIDTEKFVKTHQKEARKKLNLPENKKIVLFSADGGVSNPFKGGDFVFNIYEKLKERKDILFLNIGGEESSVLSNWINYGYIESEDKMAMMYSAADIYIFPTLADNCPLTVIEAMSCGLPVVTFDIGGVPEIVEHEKTGYVAKYKDSNDLLRGVNMLLDDENLMKEFGKSGEKRVRELFDAKMMAQKYYELYCEILNKKQ